MNKKTIAQLKKSKILLYPQIVTFYQIYNELIRPSIPDNTLLLQQYKTLYSPTIFIKEDKKLLLANNIELYNLIKSQNLDQNKLRHSILFSIVNKEDLSFGFAFYELIDIVAKYRSILNIEPIYKALSELLTQDLNEQLFQRNIFAITTFCHLIGITEQAYYSRIKRSQ